MSTTALTAALVLIAVAVGGIGAGIVIRGRLDTRSTQAARPFLYASAGIALLAVVLPLLLADPTN